MQTDAFRLTVADLTTVSPEALAASVDYQDGVLLGGFWMDTSHQRNKENCSGNGRNFHSANREVVTGAGAGIAFF